MKRAFDLALALVGLMVTSPVVLLAAAAVKIDSPGPAFYGSPRVGRDGRPFRMHKLRTMTAGADRRGPAVTAGDDSRITRVGRYLRRTKVDELPQLLNVLKGEMSMVGPRPEHPDYVRRYTPEQRRLLSVRPGVTGPAVLAYLDEEEMLRGGAAEATYLETVMPRKLELELRYLERKSLATDLGILVRTAGAVMRRGAGVFSRRRSPPR